MKKLLSRITIALFLTLYACYPVHVMADENDEGRYQAVPRMTHSDTLFQGGVWVLDKKTGQVKICNLMRSSKSVECTLWSKD